MASAAVDRGDDGVPAANCSQIAHPESRKKGGIELGFRFGGKRSCLRRSAAGSFMTEISPTTARTRGPDQLGPMSYVAVLCSIRRLSDVIGGKR